MMRVIGWGLFGLWMVFWALLLTESDPRFALGMVSRFILVAGGLAAAAAPVLLLRASRDHLMTGDATPGRAAMLVFFGSVLAVLLLYLTPMALLLKFAAPDGVLGLGGHDLDHFGIVLYMLMIAVPGLALVFGAWLLWAWRLR